MGSYQPFIWYNIYIYLSLFRFIVLHLSKWGENLVNYTRFQVNRKLSVKLMISFMVIVIMSVATLYITTVFITSRSFEKQAIEHNITMIRRIRDSYTDKCKNLKNAVSLLYSKALTASEKNDIWMVLRDTSSEMEVLDLMKKRATLINFLRNNCLSVDNDIMLASVIETETGKVYTDSNVSFYMDQLVLSAVTNDLEVNEHNERIYFINTMEGGYDKLAMIYYKIVDPDNIKNTLAYLAFGYAPEVIENSYNTYKDTKLGEILILSSYGEIMFDSEKQYYGNLFPDMEIVKNIQNGSIKFEDKVINVVYQQDYDFYVISIINKGELEKLKSPIKTIAWIGAILFMTVAGIFSWFTAKNLTKRINKLQQAMTSIKNGELSARSKLSGNDEIREIGDRFDDMCESLETYIEREYVYQMRQKEAQIFALQSQVNPHFLYNALEAIRMKAVMADDIEVSKMVVCLANIFRNNIKSDMVINLRQEIANCSSFLELYNIRYAYGIDLVCEIDDTVYRTGVIRHLLQPILENAIVHGFDLNREDNIIVIKATLDNEFLLISINDNGKGIEGSQLELLNKKINYRGNLTFSEETGSVGLANVHERIQLIYGKDCGLNINSVSGSGTCVSIKIKYKSVEELKFYVQRTNS